MRHVSRIVGVAVAIAGVALWGAVGRTMDTPRSAATALVLDVQDASGRPLPARVRVAARGTPRELAALLAKRARSHTVLGHTQIALDPAEYRVWVSHGPRHTLHTFDVTLTPGAQIRRTIVVREEVALPEHMCTDLHVHSHRSADAHHEGGVTAQALDAEGLDLTIATDHNQVGSLAGALPALSGIEVTSWAPEFGHFNAFPVHSAPRFKHSSPRQLFRALHGQGSVFVQINHPRLDDHIAYFTLGGLHGHRFAEPEFTLEGADGVEVFNGFDIARPERVLALLSEVTQLHEAGIRLTMTGGSDSHGAPGHVPGYPRTCVRTKDVRKLAQKLREGDAFVTNGPMLDLTVDGVHPGHVVRPRTDGLVAVSVEVRTHSRMRLDTVEIWAGSVLVLSVPWTAPARGTAFRLTARVPSHGARSMHARVRGGSGLTAFVERGDVTPLAFTNAVYLRPPAGHAPNDE